MERPSYDGSMHWMAEVIPELAPLLAQHEAEYDELLIYALFEDDYMGWLKSSVRDERHPAAVERFLSCVESYLHGPADELSNLAWIGFVEHLVDGGEHDVLERIRDRIGSATAAAIVEHQNQGRALGGLRREYTACRCRELTQVLDAATGFYREHLVWIDELTPGLELLKCGETQMFWASCDRRACLRPRLERHSVEQAAMEALIAFSRDPRG